MTMHLPTGPGPVRHRLVVTLLTALVSSSWFGLAHGVPPDRGEEGVDIGPRTAPVHPGYDTPEHARASVRARRPDGAGTPPQHPPAHGIATGTSATGTTSATGSTSQVTTAAATTLDPAVYGSWETLSYDLPLRAVHATALKNGKVLLIAGSGNSTNDYNIASFKAYVLDPATGHLTSVPVPYDAFCSFHLVDANGDVLVFGGTAAYQTSSTPFKGTNRVMKFVVDKNAWEPVASMAHGRWYPGGTMDGAGKVYAYSGLTATGGVGRTPEMYDPATRAWTTIAGRDLPLYPGLHTAADGRVFYSGAHYGGTYATSMPKLFHPITGAKVEYNGPTLDLSHRNMAMSALVGSADEQLVWVAGGGFPAVDTSYFIDVDAATPAAVAGPSLPAPKSYVSLANLPDLTTVETGGGAGTASPVFETSLLEPSTRTLIPMAPHDLPRTYHSSALTTRDGRVLTFGGDPGGPSNFVLKVEVFSPPYLFAGPRPTISSAPRAVAYGGTYTVGAAASGSTLHYATLLRPGSATHSTDSSQRSLRLSTRVVEGGVEITLPTNKNLAPPGWYFLSVLDVNGRPSVSEMVHVSAAPTSPPPPDTTAPTVTSRAPTAGATGVSPTGNVTAGFSEAVTGVSGTTFTLRSGTTSVPATVSHTSGTATLDPTASLAASTTYTAALTSGITDSAGNALSPVEWTFTTAAASTTRTLTVTAEADTMVKQTSPTTGYGAATTLLSDRQELSTTGSEVRSYLRFAVTGLQAGETVTGAQLSLRTLPTDGGTTNGPAVWRTENTSTLAAAESMTWNSGRPRSVGTAAVGNMGAVGHDVRVGTPVTGVTANGVVSFELAPDATDGLRFRSSEYSVVGDRPQLVLTVRTS